jgi:hypothetical protein
MVLINIFSNIWFYISNVSIIRKDDITGYNNELYILKKIQQYQHINKLINIDNETKYWDITIDFHPDIKKNIITENQSFLTQSYDKLLQFTKKKITHPDEQILFYSIENRECLLGFYLYLLNKISDIDLQSGLLTLKSKMGDITYNFSDNMTKYLIAMC